MRWKRRRLLWRAFRTRAALTAIADRTAEIEPGDVLAFTAVRNEVARLPEFLNHYRRLGVAHFLMVDNASTDDSAEMLAAEPDVSLWRSSGSYRDARFGMDWLNGLLMRHGHDHWCLTVDADETLVYPQCDTHRLDRLCRWLEQSGTPAMGAVMLDLYPKGPLSEAEATHDGRFGAGLWFDAEPYRTRRRARDQALVLQGGVRERVFFADRPNRGPTLNKLPLVKWQRGFAYSNATHAALPPRLNRAYDGLGDTRTSGVLLHGKFQPGVLRRSAEDRQRREHFGQPDDFEAYYGAILGKPDLWSEASVQYRDWRQLQNLGLMSAGGFG